MGSVGFSRIDVRNSLVERIVYQPIEAVSSQFSLNAAAPAAGADTEPAKLQSRFA
jgi:hypothetical protein